MDLKIYYYCNTMNALFKLFSQRAPIHIQKNILDDIIFSERKTHFFYCKQQRIDLLAISRQLVVWLVMMTSSSYPKMSSLCCCDLGYLSIIYIFSLKSIVTYKPYYFIWFITKKIIEEHNVVIMSFIFTHIFFVTNQLNISKFLPPQRRKTLHSY